MGMREASELAREAKENARTSQRHALGTELRLAAQAVDSAQAERAQEILRDIRLNAGGEAARSFVWRYLWYQSRRDIILLFGTAQTGGGRALVRWQATRDHRRGRGPAALGRRFRSICSCHGANARSDPGTPGLLARRYTRRSGRPPRRCRIGLGFLDLAGCHGSLACSIADGARVHCRRVRVFAGKRIPGVRVQFRSARFADAALDPRQKSGGPVFARRIRLRTLSGSGLQRSRIPTLENGTRIVIRDAGTGQATRQFSIKAGNQRFAAYTYSASRRLVAAVTETDRTLSIWEAATGKLLATHVVPGDVYRLYFSPDGSTLVAIDQVEGIHLIDRISGTVRRIASAKADRPRYSEIAFSPDSRQLATIVYGIAKGREPDPVAIWDTATARRLATFRGRREVVGKLAFPADGQSLIISSESSVRQWRLPRTNRQGSAAGGP